MTMIKKMINTVLALSFVISGISFASSGSEVTRAAAASENELKFKDISKHWAKDNIIKAYESGLVDGFPDGTFRPDDVVKADQFIVMMLNAFSETVDGKKEFAQDWFAELKNIQPGHMVTIISEVRKSKFSFETAKTGYWAKPYVDLLYKIPYLYSHDNVFPNDSKRYQKQMTREEASYLLGTWYRTYENSMDGLYEDFVLRNSGLKDFNKFSTYAGKYRAMILVAGLMNGYPNNYFYPQRYVTRAEALTMVQRLRDKALRTPFKPNLKGQYYSEVDGTIYLFSDKYKFDTYNKLKELAKTHVKSGYTDISGSVLTFFASKDAFEKYMFLTRMGKYDQRTDPEIVVGVTSGTYRQVFIQYPINKKMPNTSKYVDAVFELYAGVGKGKDLRKLVTAYEKDLYTDLKTFKFNNKNFKLYASEEDYVLEMNY